MIYLAERIDVTGKKQRMVTEKLQNILSIRSVLHPAERLDIYHLTFIKKYSRNPDDVLEPGK